MLNDQDSDVLTETINALTNIGEPAVISLIAELKNDNADIRKAAACILSKIGDSRAVVPLIETLNDKDPDVRKNVVNALEILNDARAIAPLIISLNDPFHDVREEAAKALVQIDAPILDSLIPALKDKNPNVRAEIAKILGKKRDPRAVAPLLELLKGDEQRVHLEVINALGIIADQRAVAPLLLELHHKERDIRIYAVEALGQIGDARAIEPLLPLLQDREPDVRRKVAESLAKLNATDIINARIAELEKKESPYAQQRVAEFLGGIGTLAIPPLISEESLRVIAKHYKFLIHAGEPGTETVLIQALKKYGVKTMAFHFLNSGNNDLVKAARSWASAHDYVVTHKGTERYTGPVWGRKVL
jgi:HEAT repeat protein